MCLPPRVSLPVITVDPAVGFSGNCAWSQASGGGISLCTCYNPLITPIRKQQQIISKTWRAPACSADESTMNMDVEVTCDNSESVETDQITEK
jgi:hypothetical protein